MLNNYTTEIKQLCDLFPESRLLKKGLNNNKWETDDYLICFPCGFYITKKNNVAKFIKTEDWQQTLIKLKEIQ